MSATTEIFEDGKLPILRSKVANGWKNENNFLIQSSKLVLDDSDNFQTLQATINYSNSAKSFLNSGDENLNIYELIPLNDLESPTHYENGMNLYFKAEFKNQDSPRLALNSLDPKPLLSNERLPLPANTILKNSLIFVYFDQEADSFIFQGITTNIEFGVINMNNDQSIPQSIDNTITVPIEFDNVIAAHNIFFDPTTNSFLPEESGHYRVGVSLNINYSSVNRLELTGSWRILLVQNSEVIQIQLISGMGFTNQDTNTIVTQVASQMEFPLLVTANSTPFSLLIGSIRANSNLTVINNSVNQLRIELMHRL